VTGYAYDARVYFGKDVQIASQEMQRHATVRYLTGRVEEVGHKLFKNVFPSFLI